jgi:hypothetical protein
MNIRLQAAVLAVASAAVTAPLLLAPVLAVARAAVPASSLPAPVLALRRLFRSPKSWLPKQFHERRFLHRIVRKVPLFK